MSVSQNNCADGFALFLQQQGPEEAFSVLAHLFPSAAVFVVDQEHRILFWSDGAEELLGFAAKDVLGSHCLKANRCANCIVGCGIVEFGNIKDVPLMLYHADGHPVAVKKTAFAFRDEKGKFKGGVELLVPDQQGQSRQEFTEASDLVNFHGMISRSPQMHQIFNTIRNIATSDVTVLVRGASGTGKELVARAVHQESNRSQGPFIAVNCAAIPGNLLESELFGHVKGAFTGAIANRQGLFERADGGTLFLDEVAEMPLDLQAKLLRVLQERSFMPIGGTRTVSVDIRLISATHRSLRQMISEETFREDLFYRLQVVPILLPPLRERKEDIEPLVRHFIADRNERWPRLIHQVSKSAMRALHDYNWPGNIRELQNIMDYVFAVARGSEIQLVDLPSEIQHGPLPPGTSRDTRPDEAPPRLPSNELSERDRILTVLQHTGGNNSKAAERLGISRVTLWRKRKKYDI